MMSFVQPLMLLLCAVFRHTVQLNETANTTHSCLASQTQIQENIKKLESNLSTRMGNLENSLETLRKDLNYVSDHFKHIVEIYTNNASKINQELPRTETVCKPPCVNGGQCMKDNNCRCTTPFFGDRCQEDGAKCGVDNHVEGNRRRSLLWPWMAAVYGHDLSKAEHFCSGSVIHRHFVLTSSTCLTWKKDVGLSVKLGFSDLKNGTQEYKVWSVHNHPQLDSENINYDIALLETEEPISFNRFVRPVCLPPREVPEDSPFYKPQSTAKAVNLESYIRLSPFSLNPLPHVLNLTILPSDECKRKLDENSKMEYYRSPDVSDISFCAESSSTKCPLRGSPVMQSRLTEDGTRTWTQVGTRSWTFSCELLLGPRLDRLMAWVEATIASASKR